MFQMYLVKYMLHTNLKNLNLIDKSFLNNQDYMELIGKLVGMKKEWIVHDENYYKDQAFEVIHFLYCEDRYFVDGACVMDDFEYI